MRAFWKTLLSKATYIKYISQKKRNNNISLSLQ